MENRELLIDGMNVIGSRPDGWWRDRPEAMRRLVTAVESHAAEIGLPVTVVLEGKPFDIVASRSGIDVVFAPGRGPNAADDEIVRIVERHPEPGSIEVVTSDAELAARVRRRGAGVSGADAFRRRLDER